LSWFTSLTCTLVYGANGARNIIVADVDSDGGTNDLNLLRSGNSVWEDITNNAGMGNVGVTYRQVTCPSVNDRNGGSMVFLLARRVRHSHSTLLVCAPR
jgi:hypothetical protein